MEAIKRSEFKSSTIPDERVVERILNGEKELFEILMRRYNQRLFRAVRSYLRDEDDVNDTLQDSYLKAYQKLYQFKGDAAFSTWLVRIGINEALQRLRKQKANQEVSIDRNENIQFANKVDMNPEKKVINHENRQLIERAVDRLPEKYRTIYMLREIEGMKNAEISECLELTESNVKVRFYRARNLLKESLYELSADAEIFEFGNEKCDRLVEKVMERL
ncbi:MAG TPA: RNA polymerase sigma factor [Balneolaceae bacterium]|nr:RNA polymerase sigma factor [Balneolaceae bacterium]